MFHARLTISIYMAKKILIGLFLFIVIGAASLFGLIFFSSVPLKIVASALQKNGVQVEGLRGSLNSGVSFDTFHFANDKATVTANGVTVAWSSMFSTLIARKMAVENVEANQVLIEVNGMASMAKPHAAAGAQSPDESDSKKPDGASSNFLKAVFLGVENPRGLVEFRVDQIHIKDFVLREKQSGKEVKISEYSLQALRLAYDEASLKSLTLNSNYATLHVSNLSYKSGVVSFPDPVKGSLKAEGFKELLKADVPFSLSAKFKGLTPEDVEVKVFGDKLLANGNAQQVALKFNDFSPSFYFKTAHPLTTISISSKPSPFMALMMGMMQVDGHLNFAHADFAFDSSQQKGFEGQATVNNKKYTLAVNPMLLVKSFMGPEAAFDLKGPNPQLEDNIAWILSAKPKAQLSAEELQNFDSWKVYFGASAGASAPLSPVAVAAPLPAGKKTAALKSSRRAPASIKTVPHKKIKTKLKKAAKKKRK